MADYTGFIKQHPDNPRYFLFRGEALALITATEHYGAAINLDFDYLLYLDALHEKGMRLTRTFVFYREQPGSYPGQEAKDAPYFPDLGVQNTLAPLAGSYLAPWRRSDVPGSRDGGNKFDLNQFNDEYFARLRDFCREAGKRGIVVELTFFSQMYDDFDTGPWQACPLYAANNINGIGDFPQHEFMNPERPEVVRVMETLVKRVVNELREFDNLYYEICNEPNPNENQPRIPYEQLGAWHNHFAALIAREESDFPEKHMIAVCDPNRHYDLIHVSILNFHYKEQAESGLETYAGSGRVLALDETLSGIVAWNREMDFDARLKEAWSFIMRGFGVYDYLDFTFATTDPTGTGQAAFPEDQYYNGETMRLYLKHLNDFTHALPLVRMRPDNSFIKSRFSTVHAHGMACPGECYVVYLNGHAARKLKLSLPPGRFCVRWFNPRSGLYTPPYELDAGQGEAELEIPLYEQDIVLKISRG